MRLNPIFLVRKLYQKLRFKQLGEDSYVDHPLRILGYENIVLGDYVSVHYKTWLQAIPLTGSECILTIGKGTTIGDFNHIVSTKQIIIGENVLTANHVYISDNLHGYELIDMPIKHQDIKQLPPVSIGDGSWIGENVCIMGSNVGKNCVIGANSVVTKDIPDYCVAVGAPAHIIKRYDFEGRNWRKTDSDGAFI